MHNLWVDGKSMKEFGIYVSGENTFGAPEWQYESISIPGRNGDLTIPQKRFKNITVSYPAFITSKFAENAAAARFYLLSAGAKYRRIEDDYHPDSYRLGIFSGPIDFETRFLNLSGEVSFAFNCKPQRFLKSGEHSLKIQSGQTLWNSWMPALPLIQITGTDSGEIVIGGSTVEITDIPGSITIDSDVQNAYNGLSNLNNNIIITGGFPALDTGENVVAFSGGITDVEITPRWWTL